MKILVTLKKVPDPDLKLKVNAAGTGIDTDGVKFIANYFDELAVEGALRVAEARNAGDEIVVVSIGEDVETQLRQALAMGATRAIHVKFAGAADSDLVARLLAKVYEQEKPDLVIMGKQATDDDANQAGQMLAAYVGLPQACFASKIEVSGAGVQVTREIDGGTDTVALPLPALVTVDLRLAEAPRYASLPNIMKAKKKPLAVIDAQTLGVDLSPKTRVVKLTAAPPRKAGIKVADVPALLDKLQQEAKVL